MGNNTCGMVQSTTTSNAAAMQYVKTIKRIADCDTNSIREMVKWFSMATESFGLPHMHDKLMRFAMQHEKNVNSVRRELDHYIEMDSISPQKPILANFTKRLSDFKREAINLILLEVTNNLATTSICLEDTLKAKSIPLDDVAIGRKAAAECTPDKISDKTTNQIGSIIRKQSIDLGDQMKNLNRQSSITEGELGCNLRILADFCDKLEGISKNDPNPCSNDNRGAAETHCKCKGKELSSSENKSSDSSDAQTVYFMVNKDINHILCLLSGLVTTTILKNYDDPDFLEAARTISAGVHKSLEESKEANVKRKLSPKEQVAMISKDLKDLIAYIEICQSFIFNRK